MGCIGRDPDVEYWDASKISTLKLANGSTVSLNGDAIGNWNASVGKRRLQRRTGAAFSGSFYNYINTTNWPAVRMNGYRTHDMTQSVFLFEQGETFFMAYRIPSMPASPYYGYTKLPGVTSTTAVNNGEFNSSGVNCTVYGTTAILTGNPGTYPYLSVYAVRILQNGPNVDIWAMGHSGVVVTRTITNFTWISNRNALFRMYTNGADVHIYYIEINRDIRTTAQMKARRDVLYNRYV